VKPETNPQLRRLEWRCRRGTRELDLLLERYLHTRYQAAGPASQLAFERLLELQDPVLQAYFLGTAEPQDPGIRDVIRSITGTHP
jgi:antitoxin CptB